MGMRVIHVMTHDSIGLGEDGPTHQPVEHLAALRAIPNLHVFRPADAVETAECWALALAAQTHALGHGLSRQKTCRRCAPRARTRTCRPAAPTSCAEAGGRPRVTLFATGTEVALAMAAREHLEAAGHRAPRVVSAPAGSCSSAGRRLPGRGARRGAVRVAVEAGVRQGWERFIGAGGAFVGMTGFGASAPAERALRAFGITAEAVAAAARALLG